MMPGRRTFALLAGLIALLSAPGARAQPMPDQASVATPVMKRGVYSFSWENDAFVGDKNDSDRYYTNGLKLTWVSPTLKPRGTGAGEDGELFDWLVLRHINLAGNHHAPLNPGFANDFERTG